MAATAPAAATSGVEPAKVDLEWQTFSSVSAPAPAPAPAAAPTLVTAVVAPMQLNFNPMMLLSPAFYKSLFNVDTADVVARLKVALYPFQAAHFMEVIAPTGPDMYGPIWTAATLVFIIGASSNLASWVAFDSHAPGGGLSLWHYDFKRVTLALGCVFSWSLGAPTVLWLLLQYLGVVSLGVVTLLCVYGYALATFVPAAVLCALPSSTIQWTAVVASTLTSSVFVLKSLWPSIRDGAPAPQGRALVLTMFLAQLGFGALLKLLFFG